jgi:tRNA(fMet)-specific endonuclease VapC
MRFTGRGRRSPPGPILIGNVLLDTNVASFLLKHDTRAELYRQHLDGKLWALSFQSIGEMEFWANSRGWGQQRRAKLEQFFALFVPLYPDREVCAVWGRIRGRARQAGRPIDVADAWIAATAIAYNIPLVTHNAANYKFVESLTVITAQ